MSVDWSTELYEQLDWHWRRLHLALHINREAIHHGAEIALLRDLWAHR
ncbi:hypothetical protein [Nonomuraea africana]